MSRIRAARERRSWSQQQLAGRAGVTRQLVAAVEAGRHSPNVGAALALARTLGSSVEDLFGPEAEAQAAEPVPVLGDLPTPGSPVAVGKVGDTWVTLPSDHGTVDAERWTLPDAIVTPRRSPIATELPGATSGLDWLPGATSGLDWLPGADPEGLVVAGCDPVLGILGALVERTSSQRLKTAHAPTDRAIDALADGRVHAVLVHAPGRAMPSAPTHVRAWHLARWQVGLASTRRAGPPSVEELANRPRSVVQRDPAAASQQALTRALAAVGAADPLPGPVARGHLDVARRLSSGHGRTGITMEAAAHAFELGFVPLEEHTVELWLDQRWVAHPAAEALVDVLTGAAFRQRAAHLAGYDVTDSGTDRQIEGSRR